MFRVMPAQLVAGAVTMNTYTRAQTLHFCDELLAAEPIQILIHGDLSSERVADSTSSRVRSQPQPVSR